MNELTALVSTDLAYRLGWMLLHSLWQGAAVAGLFGLAMLLIPARRPEMRYVAGCCALAVLVLACGITFLMMTPPAVPAEAVSIASPERLSSAVEPLVEEAPVLASEPMPAVAVSGEYAPVVSDQHASAAVMLAAPPPGRVDVAAPPATAESWQARLARSTQSVMPWLVVVWIAGVFGLSLWRLGGLAAVYRLRSKGTSPVGDEILAVVRRCCESLRVSRPVRVLRSLVIRTPAVIGHLRPVILLPASALTGLSAAEIEAILAHELAHIRRCDYLVCFVQGVIEIVLFHHPAVWWISRRIRIEREYCCDDLVVSLGKSRLVYAQALTKLAPLEDYRDVAALAASGGSLLERIRRLAGAAADEGVGRSRSAAGLILVVLLVVGTVGVARHILADSGEQQSSELSGQPATAPAAEPPQSSAPGLQASRDAQGPVTRPAMSPAAEDPIAVQTRPTAARGGEGFGPVIERVVNDAGTRENFLIDLDTGAVFTPPAGTHGNEEAFLKWVGNNGIDARGETKTGVQGLMGIDLVAIPIDRLELGRPDTAAYVSGRGELPATYLFTTREGGEGVLQITGLVDHPPGVKIRYKLLEDVTKREPGTQPATSPAGAGALRSEEDSLLLLDGHVETASGPENNPQASRAWHLLRHVNAGPLLQGLVPQIVKVVQTSHPREPIWTGVDDGANLDLDLRVEGEERDEILVGFFEDAGWSSRPVQVRRLAGPGRHRIERLPQGRYWIGAMMRTPPTPPVPTALGVHRTWPEPIEIGKGVNRAEVLVCKEFLKRATPYGDNRLIQFHRGGWESVQPTNLLQGRVWGPDGRGVPFAFIAIREHAPEARSIAAPNVATDMEGRYFYDQMRWPYKVSARRYELIPSVMGNRSQFSGSHEVLRGAQTVDFHFPAWPTGTATLIGRVVDQDGQPIRGFFIDANTWSPFEANAKPPSETFGYHVPFFADDGRFKLTGLPTGGYSIRAHPFDDGMYEWCEAITRELRDDATPEITIECVAKRAFYGRVRFEHGGRVAASSPAGSGAKFTIMMDLQGLLISPPGWKVDPDGQVRIYLGPREAQMIKDGKVNLVLHYQHSPDSSIDWAGVYPFEKLSGNRDDVVAFTIPIKEEIN